MPGSVPTSDFEGLVRSSCALARAAAIAPIDGLELCMRTSDLRNVEADCPGLRALCSHAMSEGLLGVLGHERLQLGPGLLVLDVGRAGSAVHPGELRPGVRGAHVNRADRL